MSTTIPKRVKRTRVLSTKVTERDSRFLQAMVNRYFEHGIIPQAKTSTLLRLIVRDFLRKMSQDMNKILLAVINMRLVNCIRLQKLILVFLPLIHSKRQIIRYGLKRLRDQALHAPIAILFSQTTFSMLITSLTDIHQTD